MNYKFEEEIKWVSRIMNEAPILKTEQLLIALSRKYNITEEYAMQILFTAQQNGYVLLSEDGWALTKGFYKTLTNDKFEDGVQRNSTYRLSNMLNMYETVNGEYQMVDRSTIAFEVHRKKYYSDIIDCFWIVASSMPRSENFVTGNAPWSIEMEVPIDDGDKKDDRPTLELIEICNITNKNESPRIEMLRTKAPITKKQNRVNVKRLAIIENEDHAWKIPYYGFTKIVTLDDKVLSHYRVVEDRDGQDVWKDTPLE